MGSGTDAGPVARKLAILGYHKVGEPSEGAWHTWYYVPEETFVQHLEILQAGGWQVVDAATFLAGLREPRLLPERTALITFDDGYRSVLEVALPRLRQFEFPAVLFVPTAYIGGTNTFDEGAEPEEPICDWAELRELELAGISVQPHGVSHGHFSDFDAGQAEQEVRTSKMVLEEHLRNRSEVFAFPYGDNGTNPPEVERFLGEAGYQAALLYGGRPKVMRLSGPIGNPYRLTRIAMGPDTDLAAILAESERGEVQAMGSTE